MEAALRSMLVHTISIRRIDVAAGYGAGGTPTYAAAPTAAPYVEQKRMRDSHPAGAHGLKTMHNVITETAITKDDLVFLHGVSALDENNGKKPVDVVVHYEPDRRDGSNNPIVSHYEVLL